MCGFVLLVLSAAKGAAAAQSADTLRIYREARGAEAEYERALRRLAPLGDNPRRGSGCDEVVGRFCLYYDTGRDPLPAEPPEIGRFRNKAIDRLQAAFAANPRRRATVFPLIRLLLEGKRRDEAKAVADVFRDSTTEGATAAMLIGLTRHAAGEITLAERAFADWLAAVDSVQRRRVRDVSALLSPRERRRYRQLRGDARTAYEERFWRYADALYLTPGNETWTDHLSRHVESKLLAAAPFVSGSTSWGSDVAELTIRYGSPKARTRIWPSTFGSTDLQLLEHWDPEQMVYAAPRLDSALHVRARPGGGWPLDTVRTLSGHAPSTLRRMLPLEHQATVFHEPTGRTLRVDGVLPLDSAPRQKEARAVLFALDPALNVVAAGPGLVRVARDSMFVSGEVALPAAARFYSMEMLEKDTRLAGRARFRIADPAPNTLQLSDVVVAEPFGAGALPVSRNDAALKPRHALLLPLGLPIGIYAEAHMPGPRPRNMRVRLRVMNAKGRGTPISMSWIEEVAREGPAAIAATVALAKLRAGRYYLELSVTDQGGRTGMTTREIVIVAP